MRLGASARSSGFPATNVCSEKQARPGFFGKFMIFSAIIAKGTPFTYGLAFVGAAGVVISLYYYLCVVKRIYADEPADDDFELSISRPMRIVLWTCLLGVFLTGILHQPFFALAKGAAEALVAPG